MLMIETSVAQKDQIVTPDEQKNHHRIQFSYFKVMSKSYYVV